MAYRKKLTRAEERIDSTIALAHAILKSGAIEPHKRQFLSYCVWKASEAAGKYNVPYWSAGVLELVEKHGNIQAVRRHHQVLHEHVHTRKSLVDKMMDDPSCVETVLRKQAFACLVTPDEHRQLKESPQGFARYKAAGIRVWDVNRRVWIDERETS